VGTDPDRALLIASIAFAGAAGVGSAAAMRDQLPGQPLGISVPLSVPAGLAAGWGAGVAAPWPMPVAAVAMAAKAQRTGPGALAGAVCATVGIGGILGTVIEPVTRRRRDKQTSWPGVASLSQARTGCSVVAFAWKGQAHGPRPIRQGASGLGQALAGHLRRDCRQRMNMLTCA
jgi:hypothetical protein